MLCQLIPCLEAVTKLLKAVKVSITADRQMRKYTSHVNIRINIEREMSGMPNNHTELHFITYVSRSDVDVATYRGPGSPSECKLAYPKYSKQNRTRANENANEGRNV
jgi:hypothetical protein